MNLISTLKYTIIGFLYRNILKRFLFLFSPEFIHNRFSQVGHLLGANFITRKFTAIIFNYKNSSLSQNIAGIKFPNPVGLSAGFDKNANLINIVSSIGFGFTEIGSITLDPYEGNPKPRLFRLKKSRGLVVYFGLKNIGVIEIIKKIKSQLKTKAVMGISVAKTNSAKTAQLENAIKDYIETLKQLQSSNTGDFYVINISCPNAFGGEPFTTEDRLEKLLKEIAKLKITKPLFVKMPINLSTLEFDSLLKTIVKYNLTGVIIGNLTKIRDSNLILDTIPEKIKGGISGKPTEKLSNDLIKYTYQNYGKKLIIIGVGGVFSAEDAYTKIKLGASLVGLITGMIFNGPQLIGEINYKLTKLLEKDGFKNISEAVGSKFH